ncbi:MAG: agmatinase [Rhodospirillales bacterium]
MTDNRNLKGERTANSFSGLPSFFRRHAGDDFSVADVVVTGLPFDLGVSNRPGARFGPRAIREASLQLAWGPVWPWGFDPFERIAVLDAGDIEYAYGDAAAFSDAAAERARAVAQAGAVPFSLGGDHGVTYPTLKGLHDVVGRVALIHFDAHSDTGKGAEVQHGTMFRHARENGLVADDRSVQIGIRTEYEADDDYLRLHAPDVNSGYAADIAKTIRSRVGDMPCYLTFDIDCLDPAFAPGTGTPVPGGVGTLKILDIIRALGDTDGGLNLVGLDMVEVAPDYDHAQITALAAVQICHELLCLLSMKGSRFA